MKKIVSCALINRQLLAFTLRHKQESSQSFLVVIIGKLYLDYSLKDNISKQNKLNQNNFKQKKNKLEKQIQNIKYKYQKIQNTKYKIQKIQNTNINYKMQKK